MTAQLSYQDTKGYYGLLVQPSYDQMLRSLKKEIRIPQPDRSAKWYATGIYRAFVLEQAKRFNDAQRKDLMEPHPERPLHFCWRYTNT